MSELEPTSTKLEPTATERLRAMLDERGVWHEDIVDATLWKGSDGTAYTAAEVYTRGNMKPSTKKLVIRHMATPEQAIAATLGDSDATAARQGDAVEVVRCRDCEHFAVDQSDHEYRSGWWCKRWDTDMVKPDGFCAWGRRADG